MKKPLVVVLVLACSAGVLLGHTTGDRAGGAGGAVGGAQLAGTLYVFGRRVSFAFGAGDALNHDVADAGVTSTSGAACPIYLVAP